jgi:hypothetical protein
MYVVIDRSIVSFSSSLGSLGVTLSHELSDNQIFLGETLLPSLKVLQLLAIEIFEVVERAFQVLGEHFLVEALVSKTARSVAAGKVFVWATLYQWRLN